MGLTQRLILLALTHPVTGFVPHHANIQQQHHRLDPIITTTESPETNLRHLRIFSLHYTKKARGGADSKKKYQELKTFQDYKGKLEELAFLSTISNGDDICQDAQEVFDSLFKRWMDGDDDNAELEPNTEIYNLLVETYCNCGQMDVAHGILDRMEEGQAADFPSANEETYISFMTAYGSMRNFGKAEVILQRVKDKYEEDSSHSVRPTTLLFNAMMETYMKFGDKRSPRKTKQLLSQMIDCANDDDKYDAPNTESFRLVMDCFARKSPKSSSAEIKELLELMHELADKDGYNDMNPYHRKIVNIQIKMISQSRRLKQKGQKAESLLDEMMERYKKNGDESERPSAASFIHAINAWGNEKSSSSSSSTDGESSCTTTRVSQLLDQLEAFYKEEMEAERDCDNLKPDKRVYNAVMKIWARSDTKGKATDTRGLLNKMIVTSQETGDEDSLPNVRSYNNVMNACAFTSRDDDTNMEEQKEALRIMVETFNEMRITENAKPNHITYGTFLKGCALIGQPAKRQSIVENIFDNCCKEGHVSDFVLYSLFDVAMPSFSQKFIGSDSSDENEDVQIPLNWSRNVE